MPIVLDVDPDRRLVRTTVVGPVAFADIRGHLEALIDANAFEYSELVDARGVADPRLSYDDVRGVAELVRWAGRGSQPGPRAILVSTKTDFTLALMFATLVTGWMSAAPFRDGATARRWLRQESRTGLSQRPPAGG